VVAGRYALLSGDWRMREEVAFILLSCMLAHSTAFKASKPYKLASRFFIEALYLT
jgi:hypothetical protein